jgi:hypothetical protein
MTMLTEIRRTGSSNKRVGHMQRRRDPTGSAAANRILALLLAISALANGQVQQRPNEGGHWWEMAPPVIIRPPQRPQNGRFRQLRFSRDGRYILAQDDSGIALLSVHPYSVLFHHFAENVSTAGFTPDSQQVWFVCTPEHVVSPQLVFAGSDSYVERWSIAEGMWLESMKIPLRACESWNLSPDSRVLACVDTGGTLRLIDVDTGKTIFEKKKFGRTWIFQNDAMVTVAIADDLGSAMIVFSPDGRFVVAAPLDAYGSTVAWNLRERAHVKLTGGLRKLERGYFFVFVAPDEVMISPYRLGPEILNATLVNFPSGKVLLKLKLPPGHLLTAADPAFVLTRPFGHLARDSDPVQRIAAVEYRTGQVIISDAQALDVFGNHYVTELKDGTVGLYERGKGVQATVTIDTH